MCLAVRYTFSQRDRLVRFTDPQARLPVLLQSGQTRLVTWGRRQNEHAGFPAGGWARFWHINSGIWDSYEPRPVKINVTAYLDHHLLGCEQWHELEQGSYLQGLLASHNSHQLVYVVCWHFGTDEESSGPCPRVI